LNLLDNLNSRLRQLKAEYEAGQRELAELEQKEAALRQTLKRISGAISVIEEELKAAKLKSVK
jgi:septal ring factor EnvC (AmiA/AmiB activator)